MKKYTVEKKIKKLSRPEGWAIVLIVIGLILLILERWGAIHSFRDLTKILDSLLFPFLGILMLISSSRQIKKIRGSYIKLDADNFSFKSRGIEKDFDSFVELQDIHITLETIKITDTSKNVYLIFLDDYINEGEQKEIKEYFNQIAEKIKKDKSKS